MTGVAKLFSASGKAPSVLPPVPKIGDAAGEAASRQYRSTQRKKYGVEDTILTGRGAAPAVAPPVAPVTRTTLGA